MKTKTVPSEDIDPAKGLKASDYVIHAGEDDVPIIPDLRILTSSWEGIRAISAHCFRTAWKRGWWRKYAKDDGTLRDEALRMLPEIIGSKLMLQVSELVEALEEIRNSRGMDEIYYKLYWTDENGVECSRECSPDEEGAKPEGVPIELADAVIRIFDLAIFFHIDLTKALRIKMFFNEGRPHKHGGKTI